MCIPRILNGPFGHLLGTQHSRPILKFLSFNDPILKMQHFSKFSFNPDKSHKTIYPKNEWSLRESILYMWMMEIICIE